MYVVTTVVKPIFRGEFGYPIAGVLDVDFPGLAGAGLARSQPSFALVEG